MGNVKVMGIVLERDRDWAPVDKGVRRNFRGALICGNFTTRVIGDVAGQWT